MNFTNLLVGCILFLFATSSFGKVIYFGEGYRNVEVLANETTLLLFPSPAVSTNCQPASIFKFTTVKSSSMSVQERTQLKSKTGSTSSIKSLIKRMLRVFPTRVGSAKCVVNLVSGEVAGLNFISNSQVIEPFIEFQSIEKADSYYISKTDNKALETMRALLKGDPLGFFSTSKSYMSRRQRAGSHISNNYGYSKKLADYHVKYEGTNGKAFKAFKVKGKLKRSASYDNIVGLENSSGSIIYSAVLPNKNFYKKNDEFYLFVLSNADLSFDELRRDLK